MADEKKQKVERVQFRATFDTKSAEYLEALSRHLRQKRSPLLAELILSTKTSKKLSSQVLQFYRNKWPIIMPRKIETGRLFNWPLDVDDALKQMSWDVIGTGNKSETLRVLLAFYADQNGFLEKSQ
jgi:hypothetical protein